MNALVKIVTGRVPVNVVTSRADLERGNHSSVTEHLQAIEVRKIIRVDVSRRKCLMIQKPGAYEILIFKVSPLMAVETHEVGLIINDSLVCRPERRTGPKQRRRPR